MTATTRAQKPWSGSTVLSKQAREIGQPSRLAFALHSEMLRWIRFHRNVDMLVHELARAPVLAKCQRNAISSASTRRVFAGGHSV